MGKRGPAKQPDAIQELHGRPGKRPPRNNMPVPPGQLPTCPDWLGDVGRKVWDKVAPILDAMGVLTSVDGNALACYCEAWEDFQDARDEIETDGSTCTGKNGGAYLHPAVGRKNKAIERIKQFGAKFGMTPSDRTGIEVPGDTGDDGFDDDISKHG